jgi:hypothetical protein
MSAESIKTCFEERLRHSGLLPALDSKRTQFLDLPGGTYAELVLVDGGKEEAIRQILSDSPSDVDLRLHPIWEIENIGEPEIAISATGGIIAASVVGVRLKSGTATTVVQVAITWLAQQELKQMLGGEPDLKRLAREYVENWLQWGGESYWDPRQYPRLEIAADRALSLYRSLQKTA